MESRKKKELREALKLVIKSDHSRGQEDSTGTVISSSFILDEMVRSIEEAKRQVIALVRLMRPRERKFSSRG
jgi:hypothetical protein